MTEADALLVQAIRIVGDTLPDDVRDAVLARGEDARSALLELAKERKSAPVVDLRTRRGRSSVGRAADF